MDCPSLPGIFDEMRILRLTVSWNSAEKEINLKALQTKFARGDYDLITVLCFAKHSIRRAIDPWFIAGHVAKTKSSHLSDTVSVSPELAVLRRSEERAAA